MSMIDPASVADGRALLEKITKGPWQVVEDGYEPREGKPSASDNTVAQRRIFTAWDHPQMRGPIGVVNSFVTIGKVMGQSPYHGVSISEADAQFIVWCRTHVPQLLDELEQSEQQRKERHYVCEAHVPLGDSPHDDECPCCLVVHENDLRKAAEAREAQLRSDVRAKDEVILELTAKLSFLCGQDTGNTERQAKANLLNQLVAKDAVIAKLREASEQAQIALCGLVDGWPDKTHPLLEAARMIATDLRRAGTP